MAADKFLTEGEWKKFAKGRDLKDAALLKALAAFEKAKKPDEQLEALAAIEKEIDGLRRFVKGDREFGAQLDAMEKAHAKEEKQAKSAPAETGDGGDDEEDSPALLTTKLIPLLRDVKKGELTLSALIVLGAKEAAVLISRRAIPPARKKLLADYLGESGAVKTVAATCLFEENAITFVVQAPAAGLAKKLRAALFKQTDLRQKVRVRGEDGAVDDDGADSNEGAEHEGSEHETAEDAASSGPDFNHRLADVMARVKPTLLAGGATAAAVKQKLLDAGNAARQHQFAAANGVLDEVETLLKSGVGRAPAHAGNWKQARQQWQDAMESVDAQLNALRAAILQWLDSGDAEVAEYGDGMRQIAELGLSAMTADRRVKLMASLMELGSGEPAQLKAGGAKALPLIRDFEAFLGESERVAACDENDLNVAVSIRATLTPPLRAMAAALDSALA